MIITGDNVNIECFAYYEKENKRELNTAYIVFAFEGDSTKPIGHHIFKNFNEVITNVRKIYDIDTTNTENFAYFVVDELVYLS
jgi:hypothetical protein